MTRHLQTLQQALDEFDVAVLDQWGVLHDGSTPYPHAASAMTMLARHGKKILVLSNSGKRAAPNLARIERIGLPTETISRVITSGEALWEDLSAQQLTIGGRVPKRIYPICGKENDARQWAAGRSQIELTDKLDSSVDAIMLMGLADGTLLDAYDDVFSIAIELKTPLVCSNPDKTSPRASGLVVSPGALADRFHQMGGEVVWYGKPNANIFRAVQRTFPELPANRFVMVGDSLEHDIAGAQAVGIASAFIRDGIHAHDFTNATSETLISEICDRLVAQAGIRPPDFSLKYLA